MKINNHALKKVFKGERKMFLLRTKIFCLPLKHFSYTLDSGDEGINVLASVVESKAGTTGSLYAQTVHQRFGTMVAGTNGDTEAVEQSAHIEVVDKRPPGPL